MSDIRIAAARAAEDLARLQGPEADKAVSLLLKIAAMKPVAYITDEGLHEVAKGGKAIVFKPGYQPYKECFALYVNT